MGLFGFGKKKSSSQSSSDWDDDDIEGEGDDDGETLDVYDAAEIWLSHGKDEDYTFGYDEDELEDALR